MPIPLAMTSSFAQGEANQTNLQAAQQQQAMRQQAMQSQAQESQALAQAAAQQQPAQGMTPNQQAAVGKATQVSDMAAVYDRAAQTLAREGNVTGAMSAAKQAADIRQKAADAAYKAASTVQMTVKAKQAQIAQLSQQLGAVTDQRGFDAWTANYVQQTGQQPPGAGMPFSPELKKSIMLQGESVNNQLEEVHRQYGDALKQITVAQQQQRVDLAKQQLALAQGKDARAAAEAKTRLGLEQDRLDEVKRHDVTMEGVAKTRVAKEGTQSKVALGKSITGQDIKTAQAVLATGDAYGALDGGSQQHVAAATAAYAKKLQGEGMSQYDALQEASQKANAALAKGGVEGKAFGIFSRGLPKGFSLGAAPSEAPAPKAAQPTGGPSEADFEQAAKASGVSVDAYKKWYNSQHGG